MTNIKKINHKSRKTIRHKKQDKEIIVQISKITIHKYKQIQNEKINDNIQTNTDRNIHTKRIQDRTHTGITN